VTPIPRAMFTTQSTRVPISLAKPRVRQSARVRRGAITQASTQPDAQGDNPLSKHECSSEQRRRLPDDIIRVMRGDTARERQTHSHARVLRGSVRAGRIAAVTGACVVAGALASGLAPTPKARVANAGTSSFSSSRHAQREMVGSNLTYLAQRVFGWPLYGKVFVIMCAMVPLVLVAAAAYKFVSEEEWGSAIAKTFFWLNDVPGADSTGEEHWRSTVVAQLIVFCGMFTFAILIGVVSDEIASKVDEVKTGNSKVYEKNHTVIVNWNDQLIPLLKQMAVAKDEGSGFQRPIVLLANKEKEWMDETIADELADVPPITIVTRQGEAYNAEDLDRVNAWSAERVVVLHPDIDEDEKHDKDALERVESNKATAVLNLRSEVNGLQSRAPDIIVQMPFRLAEEDNSVSLAVALTNKSDRKLGDLAYVNGTSELSKLKAFSIMQPGGIRLFEDLMLQTNDSSEFYTYSHKTLAGKSFKDAWRMFSNGTMVGLMGEDGKLILGPRDDDVVNSKGEVLVIADNLACIVRDIEKKKGIVPERSIPEKGSQHMVMNQCPIKLPHSKKIVMLGWNEESEQCIDDILALAPPGSQITIISEGDVPKQSLVGNQHCKIKHIREDARKRSSMEKAQIAGAEAVVIMSPSDSGAKQSDSYSLSSIMQVAYLVKGADLKQTPHIVVELSDEVAQQVAEAVYEGIGTIDVVLRDNLISGALLQVSANTKLAGLFDFLLEKDGKELYMRPYDEFVTSNDGELTWGTLCERAREREEIAIGVVRAGGEFSMSPSKSSTFKLSIGDKIVVLAEDWWDAKSVNVKAQTAF